VIGNQLNLTCIGLVRSLVRPAPSEFVDRRSSRWFGPYRHRHHRVGFLGVIVGHFPLAFIARPNLSESPSRFALFATFSRVRFIRPEMASSERNESAKRIRRRSSANDQDLSLAGISLIMHSAFNLLFALSASSPIRASDIQQGEIAQRRRACRAPSGRREP
jgi:hypothetical protein